MSDKIWVVGAEQHGTPHWTREWRLYKRGVVVGVEGNRVTRALEYQSPPEHCPDDRPSIVFKAATVVGDRAYLCTQTEVLICDFPSFAIRKVISLPCFNDLHHVTVAPDGRLFVAVTGLDAVAELTPEGKLIRLVSVLGGSVWDRFAQTTDYRKVPTTKPHRAHPNFVFFVDGQPWVTRFEQHDAIPLDGHANGRPPFDLGVEGVHDGHVAGNLVYFTAINGLVLRFDLASGDKQIFDLNTMGALDERPLGWCRGILPVGDSAWVGFSRIRYTTLRHNLDWMRHGFSEAARHPLAPTRIAKYDFAQRLLVEEINLEEAGLNTVFSIHAPQGDRPAAQIDRVVEAPIVIEPKRGAAPIQCDSGPRFSFGENWKRFLAEVDDHRISQVEKSLQQLLGRERLDGVRFIDIGSGSGLSSLAARRLGASVHSFDEDPISVKCTATLQETFAPGDPQWRVEQGSVLDSGYLSQLGQFDVVYSWGVLHHTGAMRQAIDNASRLVAPNGQLVLALYRKTRLCWLWAMEKRWYCGASPRAQHTANTLYITSKRLAYALSGRDFNAAMAEYHSNRGMSYVHDVRDWLGGYPYESIRPDEVAQVMTRLGFAHVRSNVQPYSTGVFGSGCDEYVYARH
ncbi:MAG TPA: methyltransferase domain-containing protein [Pseudolabrys sp.]|nr:methyltransferase domain-containing protein [Pseudolabrys sp.]